MESLAKTRLPLHRIIYPSSSLRTALQHWYNPSLIYCLPKGEKVKGLIFHSKYPFLAIHAKGGESISSKQKDRTTTNFKKNSLSICIKESFSIGILFLI
jgi:hypothetical protein